MVCGFKSSFCRRRPPIFKPILLAHNVQRVALGELLASQEACPKYRYINYLRDPSEVVPWVQMSRVPACLGLIIGVQFDDAIRDHRSEGSLGSSCNSPQEIWLAACPDRFIPHLLWLDDHADCGAGTNDRVAACVNPRAVPRQHRALRREDESSGRAPDPSSDTESAEPVDPGTIEVPVVPGSTAATCSEPGEAEDALPGAFKTGIRSSGYPPLTDHDLATLL